jgi:hypothetical protein
MDVSRTGTDQEVTPRPEHELMLASFVGLALLNTLVPAERDPFVVHDMFDVSFNEIAPIVERSPAAGQPGTPQSRQASVGEGRISHGSGNPSARSSPPPATAIDMIADAGRVRELDLVVGDW